MGRLRFRRIKCQLHRIVVVEEAPDVLAIQETKSSTEKQVDEALKSFPSTHEFGGSHTVGTSAACIFFLRKELNKRTLSLLIGQKGRFIFWDVELSAQP